MIVYLTKRTSVNTDFVTKIHVNDYYEKFPQTGRPPITVDIHLNTISSIDTSGKSHAYSYDKVTIDCNSRADADDLLSKLAGVTVVSQEFTKEFVPE